MPRAPEPGSPRRPSRRPGLLVQIGLALALVGVVPLALAATWSPQAHESAARIAAVEATSAGLHWTFAPMIDIARDPRWGRIVEGAGEDPYLGARMAEAQRPAR